MKSLIRTLAYSGLVAVAAFCIAAPAVAGYPEKPIRLVVPFDTGSVTDLLARITATELSQSLGQPVVVENRPGAGGNIGAAYVAKAPADGYTLLLGPASTNAINPSLYRNLPFDPLKDFAPITNVASVTNVLVVHPDVPARSVGELIELARKNQYAYASGGAGGSQHLSGEMFKSMSKTDILHVPYKGGGAALADLLSNRVQMMFCNLPVCLPHIQSGKLVALGVTSRKRSELLPNVPTVAERGLPEYEVDGWFGLFAPAGTPSEVIAKLNGEMQKILSSDAVRQQLLAQGATADPRTPEDFARFVKAEHDKWAQVIRAANISIE
jgi:Uncharacterized protein conserved in bacteria